MRKASVLITALVIALAGCGGGGGNSPDDEVRSTVAQFQDAALSGDDAAACSLLSKKGKYLATLGGVVSCGVKDLRGIDSLAGAGITNVAVSGSSATVALDNGGKIELTEQGNEWLIDSFPFGAGAGAVF